MFVFPQEIRRVTYTNDAIEFVNMIPRKVTHNHRFFPSDEAVLKVVYLVIQTIARK